MNDQKISKDMGNLSRASDEMKKKLELSFAPQPMQKPENQNTEVNKALNTDLNKSGSTEVNKTINPETPISGNIELKPSSINTESQTLHTLSQVAATKTGSRYKKITPRAKDSLKSKATFCLDLVAVEQLNQIYIKRLSTHQKSDRSSLICEAISLLFEREKLV